MKDNGATHAVAHEEMRNTVNARLGHEIFDVIVQHTLALMVALGAELLHGLAEPSLVKCGDFDSCTGKVCKQTVVAADVFAKAMYKQHGRFGLTFGNPGLDEKLVSFGLGLDPFFDGRDHLGEQESSTFPNPNKRYLVNSQQMTRKAKILFRKNFQITLPKETIQRESELMLGRLIPIIDAHSHISLFLSMPHEIDTYPIAEHILRCKKSLYVPRCTGGTMAMVRIGSFQEILDLPRNSWGIAEPLVSNGDVFLDLIIMPGMAFDNCGNRIGYGKGYYDRFIQRCRTNAINDSLKTPETVAIGLSQQLVESVPIESTDQKPDLILISGESITEINA